MRQTRLLLMQQHSSSGSSSSSGGGGRDSKGCGSCKLALAPDLPLCHSSVIAVYAACRSRWRAWGLARTHTHGTCAMME